MSASQRVDYLPATPAAAVEETIATYDADAETYGDRFAHVDFKRYLIEFLAVVPSGTTVLDAGCGSGRDLAAFTGHGVEAIGIDRSEGMLKVARRTAPRAGVVQADLRCLPFANAALGGVWNCASLLHLAPPDAALALDEIRRVLRPNGALFLSVAAGQGSEWRGGPRGRRWFHYYERDQLEHILGNLGMVVLRGATEPGLVRGTWVNLLARKQ